MLMIYSLNGLISHFAFCFAKCSSVPGWRLLQDIRILIYFKIANHCCSLRGPDVKVDYNCTWIFPRVVVKNVFSFVVISWFCFLLLLLLLLLLSAQIEKLRKSVVTQRIATLFKEDIGNCWSDLGPFLEVRESEIRNPIYLVFFQLKSRHVGRIWSV